MQKPWSEIKVGNTIKTGVNEHVVLEVGVSGKTFLMSRPTYQKDGSTTATGQWVHIEEAERFGWTLHGEPEKWGPKQREWFWFLTTSGVSTGIWSETFDHDTHYGLGIYPTQESAQAMFEKLKKVAKGEV